MTLLFAVSVSVVHARGVPGDGRLIAIEAEYRSGGLSLDEWALLTAQAIRTPGELSAKYAQSGQAMSVPNLGIDPTLALREIYLNWDELSASTQMAISVLLTRHETNFSYHSASGFFLLHYDTLSDSTHAVPADDGDSSGVPDFVEKIAAYLDSSLVKHQVMGYLMPPSDGGVGGDSSLDVYFQEMLPYGYTTPEGHGPAAWDDRASHMVLHNSFLGFDPNDDPEGDQWGAAKSTAAHEFHHCIQFGYDFGEEAWFVELDAVFMEEITFDASNDCHNYLSNFFTYPEKSLMETGYHAYASFHYGLFLAQMFDTSLMRSAWEGSLYTTTVFEALADTLETVYGWTTDSAAMEFSLWNYFTGLRNDDEHHEEAVQYPLATVGAAHFAYPVPVTGGPSSPAGYGTTYIELYPTGELKTMNIGFNGSDSYDWAVTLITTRDDTVHEFIPMVIQASNKVGEVTLLNSELYQRTCMVVVNITEYGASGQFSYSATVIDPHEVTFSVITLDSSAVYSGNVREFECLLGNPSPLHDIYYVKHWDNQGWLPLDSFLVPLAPGEDSVVSVEVLPPPGTPLDQVSLLGFEAVSVGNPEVRAQDSSWARVTLYRGDVNFDGDIDISDLIYVVDYFFTDGPEPLPVVDAADHDCSAELDIVDLVHMVTWMFQDGPPCPCNPY